jgi:hypothetical protein
MTIELPQGWQGLVSLAVSVLTFMLYISGGLRKISRDRCGDLRDDFNRCRADLDRKDEVIRDLERVNERLMRRIALRNGDHG